jgi:hypothetical protein
MRTIMFAAEDKKKPDIEYKMLKLGSRQAIASVLRIWPEG